MAPSVKWELTKAQQKRYIDALTQELVLLRARLGISQAELSKLIGVSRQTYSSIENGNREMSWNTYLSLIVFYDNNAATHNMLRKTDAFPQDLFNQFNEGQMEHTRQMTSIAGIPDSITEKLDAQAFHAIRTMIMVEYARCTNLPGESVVKAFDGVQVTAPSKQSDFRLLSAMKSIRDRNG